MKLIQLHKFKHGSYVKILGNLAIAIFTFPLIQLKDGPTNENTDYSIYDHGHI